MVRLKYISSKVDHRFRMKVFILHAFYYICQILIHETGFKH